MYKINIKIKIFTIKNTATIKKNFPKIPNEIIDINLHGIVINNKI